MCTVRSLALGLLTVLVFHGCYAGDSEPALPVIINTWPFTEATAEAMNVLQQGGSYLDAVEMGCSKCETLQCDGSVGYGGSPDELGNTTLDAMIMDGTTHDVGSVGDLTKVRSAISVARAVMEHTEHTLLVGDAASNFALQMGFKEESLDTNKSLHLWKSWQESHCQPNFRQNVSPDPTKFCGPYKPDQHLNGSRVPNRGGISRHSHDTIGMVVIDAHGNIAAGTTTNGATHKIPGRVGDSPIAGAGAYVDKDIGGAACTGDGDKMMRFLPSYQAVEFMRSGMSPQEAAEKALARISLYYKGFSGAIIVINKAGQYGAATSGFSPFPYTVYNPQLGKPTVFSVKAAPH